MKDTDHGCSAIKHSLRRFLCMSACFLAPTVMDIVKLMDIEGKHKSKKNKNKKASQPNNWDAKDAALLTWHKVKTVVQHLMSLSHPCLGLERWQQRNGVVPPLMITQFSLPGLKSFAGPFLPPHSSVPKHSRYPSMAHNPEKKRQVIFITLSQW